MLYESQRRCKNMYYTCSSNHRRVVKNRPRCSALAVLRYIIPCRDLYHSAWLDLPSITQALSSLAGDIATRQCIAASSGNLPLTTFGAHTAQYIFKEVEQHAHRGLLYVP